MKVINVLIDSTLSYIKYCFPNCENFEELKLYFRIDIDNKNGDEIRKILKMKYSELYDFLHSEISNINICECKILFNKIKNTYDKLAISTQSKNIIYDKLVKLSFCLQSDNSENLICYITKDFIFIISTIIFSFIKKHILNYLEIIKILNNTKKNEKNINKLIFMKKNIINIIIKNLCPLILHKNNFNDNIFSYDNIYNINEYLKEEINNIKGGATKYNSETIQTIINSLENIKDSDNTLYDREKVNEFINFLKDPNTKNVIDKMDGLPYNFDDTVNKLNIDTLNNEGYVSLSIFNELMDTDIGHKLLKIFTGKTPDEISGIIFKSEELANNGDILDDNSFGFKKGDIVLISVLECLDALKKKL